MRDLLRLAIVDPSDVTRKTLRDLLLGMEEHVFLLADTPRYEYFADVVADSHPDAVIVSLDSDQAKALALIAQLHELVPDMPILAISARGDGQAILQALRSGAREFITAPPVAEEIIRAFRRLGPRSNGENVNGSLLMSPKQESLVIAILGSRGGVGCTSLAVNLAANIAQEPNTTTALIDLDLALGDIDVALDLIPDYTLENVIQTIDEIDMTFLKRHLSKHACGVALLPHPIQIEDAHLIEDKKVERMINLMRATYTHQIYDLSKSFSPTDVVALHHADVIVLVAQLELTSLRNVVRILMTLEGELSNKVKIVLNRVGTENDIPLQKAEETTGKPIFWQVPNDVKTMDEARNHGVPLLTGAPKSKIHQCILGLARALCGRETKPIPDKPSSRWSALFTRR